HLHDAELVLVSNLELHGGVVLINRFRDVAQTLDSFSDLNEGSELRCAQNLALDHIANAVLSEERIPDIGLQLFDAKRQATILGLNTQNNSLDLLTLLQDFGGVLDALCPAQVRNVNEAVDAVFDLDEGAKVSQVAHAALDDSTGRVLVLELLPWILLKLLHAQRDATVVWIDAQNDGVYLIARLHQLRGVLHTLGPGHLGDVNETFDALLQF